MDFYQASAITTPPPDYDTFHHAEGMAPPFDERDMYLETKLKILNRTMDQQFQTMISLFNKVLNKPENMPQSGWQQFTGNITCNQNTVNVTRINLISRNFVPGIA